MKVLGLDGKEYNLSLKYKYDLDDTHKSSLHIKARNLLKEVYRFMVIYEEVHLPSTKLYADFFIPILDLMVEVQGQQHFQFNRFFCGGKNLTESKQNFSRANVNDREKMNWAEINNITLIYLNYNETEEQWTKKLQKKNN